MASLLAILSLLCSCGLGSAQSHAKRRLVDGRQLLKFPATFREVDKAQGGKYNKRCERA